ncbi:MAG: PilN domain-containing protein [Deltaproteobacteria bacterium]|nr:PilN domain-containing protein [Deltaproteobacteria bacterium]
MIQRINLSSRKHIAARETRPAWTGLLLALFLLLFLGLAGHYLYLRHQLGRQAARLRQLQQRYAAVEARSRDYRQLLDQVHELERQYQVAARQVQLAEELKKSRRDWYAIVAAISRRVPKKAWLTEISSAEETATGPDGQAERRALVRISGRALDSAAVVAFLRQLQREKKIFAVVDFDEVVRVAADERTGIPAHFSFVITCRVN